MRAALGQQPTQTVHRWAQQVEGQGGVRVRLQHVVGAIQPGEYIQSLGGEGGVEGG